MSVYDHFDFQTTIKKGTILCNFEKKGNKYYSTLDYSLYYLIQKFRKELKPLSIYFYYTRDDILFDVIDKNIMKRNGVQLNKTKDDIEFIIAIEIDYIPFLPLIQSKEFYHYHEHKLKRNDIKKNNNFWNLTLDEQIDTLSQLKNNKWSQTIHILSLMINTDLTVHGKFKRESKKMWESYLYKVQNHSLILFDLDGDEKFKKKKILDLLQSINYYNVMLIHISEHLDNKLHLNEILDDKWKLDDENNYFDEWKVYSIHPRDKKIEIEQIGDKICIANDNINNEKNIDNLKDDFIHKQYSLSDFQNKTLENGLRTIEIQNEIIKKQNNAIQTISIVNNDTKQDDTKENTETNKNTTVPTMEDVEKILDNQNNQLDNTDIEGILRNTGMSEEQINNIL